MVSKFNGQNVELNEPFELIRLADEQLTVTMTYQQYIEFMSNTKINMGYYFNDIYGYAVLYILVTKDCEIIDKYADGKVTIKADVYRQTVIGNAEMKLYTTGREMRYFEFYADPNKLAFASSRCLARVEYGKNWTNLPAWTVDAPNDGTAFYFTGQEIREVTL